MKIDSGDIISNVIDGVLEFATEVIKMKRAKKAAEQAAAVVNAMRKDAVPSDGLLSDQEMYLMGARYYNGTHGHPQNHKRALEYFNAAAEEGYPDAQFAMGMMYLNEEGGLTYCDEAARWLGEAAGKGHTEAMVELGNLLVSGRWLTDPELAVSWYENAAEYGHSEAQMKLFAMYFSEEAVKDRDKAAYFAKLAAENGVEGMAKVVSDFEYIGYSGDPAAVAEAYYEGKHGKDKDWKKAIWWLTRLADKGDAAAKFKLGKIYAAGESGEDEPTAKFFAKMWYEDAANAGYNDAQHNLALLHYQGYFGDVDYESAFKWMNQSAQSGDSESQFIAGVMYYNGEGVEQNQQAGLELIRKAALQGNEEAQEVLGQLERG